MASIWEILGAIKYDVSQADPTTPLGADKVFKLADCSNITIEGPVNLTGEIYSDYNPATTMTGIARAFSIEGGCNEVTIKNLRMRQLQKIADVIEDPENLDFINLHGEDMVSDGIFLTGVDHPTVSKASYVLIRDCSIITTHVGHGFRGNANEISVQNSRAYDTNSSGMWIQAGNTTNPPTGGTYLSSADRFATNRWVGIGPNRTIDGNEYEFLKNVHAQRMRFDVNASAFNKTLFVHMGTTGACLVNLCDPIVHVGEPAYHMKDFDDINWGSIIGPVCGDPNAQCGPANSPVCVYCSEQHLGDNVDPISYDFCFADITNDDVVNIDDLLAVVTAWGACPEQDGIAGPRPYCAADIHPNICGNNTVNIDDLLVVINNWGDCPTNPACGSSSGRTGVSSGGAPQSIEDCYDQCIAQYPEGGDAFIAAYDACIESLCRAQIIECD